MRSHDGAPILIMALPVLNAPIPPAEPGAGRSPTNVMLRPPAAHRRELERSLSLDPYIFPFLFSFSAESHKKPQLSHNSLMGSNQFGQLFRITTFGESHGPAIGVVIDGCPAGLPLTVEEIEKELSLRRPGYSPYTSPRKEADIPEILSGLHEGKTTGAPIAICIRNRDVDSAPYAAIKELYRPGHANYTYLQKYGHFDERGGGRASARETAARVAAGAVAKKLLATVSIECTAFLSELGGIKIEEPEYSTLRSQTLASPLFCPDEAKVKEMISLLESVQAEGDSLGGVVSCIAKVPSGLGDPVYAKLEALLAFAMLSIPATKGFEIGSGFEAARMRGSTHNDRLVPSSEGMISFATNHAGGTLGGISTGAPLYFRVAFKPTSSIQQPQLTTTLKGETALLTPSPRARHDPCVAIRGVPVVEAMTALVLADAYLLTRTSRISP